MAVDNSPSCLLSLTSMKFLVFRSDFAQLIGKVQGIVPTKPSIPILANVLIEARQDQLILSATDLTVSIRAFCEAKVEEEGAITLPARRLFQLAREILTPQIELETLSPEVVTLHAGSSHFKIQGMHKREFPLFPDLSGGSAISFQAMEFKDMLLRTAFAAAREDPRPALVGILLEKSGKSLTFVGTDGKKLAKNQLELTQEASEKGTYIIPLSAIEEIIKLIDGKEEAVTLTFLQDKMHMEIGPVKLITKLLNGPYPEYGRVIPNKSESPLKLHREELIALLRQVSLFTSETNSGVRFSFAEGLLHLSAMSGEIGEGKVRMPVNYTGSKLEMAFNPQCFLDILRHSKDEVVYFNVSEPYSPGLITDSSQAQFVIMPMRM